MSINKQLSTFYVKQGLTGKHLRSALKYDRKAVRQNIANPACYGVSSDTLWSAFSWDCTPQGGKYWAARVD